MLEQERIVRAILLNDAFRVAGTAEINGKPVSWTDAYLLTVLPLGDRRGDARKYTVQPELADSVALQLATVGWGSVVTLRIKEKLIVDLTVELDWSVQVTLD